MFGLGKAGARRAEIRKNRPDAGVTIVSRLRAEGALVSLAVAGLFCACAALILVLRENVVRYRPGQWTRHDIVSRVDFAYHDAKKLNAKRQDAWEKALRVYKPADRDIWLSAQDELSALPDRVKGISNLDELPGDLKGILDGGALSALQAYQVSPQRENYERYVRNYITGVRSLELIILPVEQQADDLGRFITIAGRTDRMRADLTLTLKNRDDIALPLTRQAGQNFTTLSLQQKVVAITLKHLAPTHVLDDVLTAEARNQAAAAIPASEGDVVRKANMPIVDVPSGGGEIRPEDWQLLRAENKAFLDTLGMERWGQRAGLAGIVLLMTIVAGAYVARYQQRIVRNHARALGIALLMLFMLLLPLAAGLGSSSIYFFGIAPTLLVAMILTIAYDQRFALGMATFHAVLVTFSLDADLSFLTILEAGVVTACFMLDDLRSRSRLIEIGGAAALVMIVATAAAGLLEFDPLPYIARNCLHVGAAGLAVGFVILGILPFIEKMFRITTSMTLLELADASQPLLRRLSLEAPGTYAHSLQVATLAEEAAEVIGAKSLLCRVAAYYHDIGKINKADYFVENQVDGQNRHINLSPNVSLLIIIGHVKDGLELAREYNLPTSIFPFIQQHHGTTLVEFFYHRARDAATPDQPDVSETQYRYPGPKPKTREIAVLMLADAAESACRAMPEPTGGRIEALVRELVLRRLQDGQFDECDLTLRDLDLIERSLCKTLQGIYHGRLAYPSTSAITSPPAAMPATPNIKTA